MSGLRLNVIPAPEPASSQGRGARQKVLMVYPTQGFSGVFVSHLPLGLLYASAAIVKAGIEVEILDNRLHPDDWQEQLRRRLSPETLIVGISVMSGTPIRNAIATSRLVKAIDPTIRVVWGGPHATFVPESILDEASVDYVISGYGNEPFHQLVTALMTARPVDSVPGLSFRRAGRVVSVPENKAFEEIPYRDIPYHLVKDFKRYGQLESRQVIVSMYSVNGCPYQCTFCSSPAQYRDIPGKAWVPLDVREVVNHIEYVVDEFGAEFIYFIDDDSFPKLSHVESIIDGITARGLRVKLGFRGARINEVKRMSHAYLAKLAAAGTDIMHIGVESGSDRILRLIKKDCTVEDILECNRKLAQHPEISVGYNIMMGIPSETMDELRATRDLMLRLVEDNPRAIIFAPNKFRPLPGTELFDIAVRDWGYSPPRTLEEWSKIEVEGDYSALWYPPGMEEFCRLLLVSSYFIDGKMTRLTSGTTPFYRALRAFSTAYAPIARWRLRNGYDQHLVEYDAYRWAQEAMQSLQAGSTPFWRALRPWLTPGTRQADRC